MKGEKKPVDEDSTPGDAPVAHAGTKPRPRGKARASAVDPAPEGPDSTEAEPSAEPSTEPSIEPSTEDDGAAQAEPAPEPTREPTHESTPRSTAKRAAKRAPRSTSRPGRGVGRTPEGEPEAEGAEASTSGRRVGPDGGASDAEPGTEAKAQGDSELEMSDPHPATSGHGHPAEDACSVLWDHDGTSAYGTAATALFFVVVEQPGPWGRDAARESHLDVGLGIELDARCARSGGRFMLMRRPGGHPDRTGPRRVFLAHAGERADQSWLLAADVEHLGDLLGLDWGALARGSRALVQASVRGATQADPTLLVCTNGRRDVCCAVRGRSLASAAAHHAPGRVWEVSHTGGHRFAPTAVLLPWGQTYARLDEQSSVWALDAVLDGHTPAELLGPLHDRGRSGIPAVAQCAESTVRAAIGETHLASLSVADSAPRGDGHDVTVAHTDGRRWLVRVTRAATGTRRPESCGKKAIEVHEHRGQVVEGPTPGRS